MIDDDHSPHVADHAIDSESGNENSQGEVGTRSVVFCAMRRIIIESDIMTREAGRERGQINKEHQSKQTGNKKNRSEKKYKLLVQYRYKTILLSTKYIQHYYKTGI